MTTLQAFIDGLVPHPAERTPYLRDILGAHTDKPLSELDQHTVCFDACARSFRDVAERDIPDWDSLDADQRAAAIARIDCEADERAKAHDAERLRMLEAERQPGDEAERTYAWDLACRLQAVKSDISEWSMLKPNSITEREIQENKLQALKENAAQLLAELNGTEQADNVVAEALIGLKAPPANLDPDGDQDDGLQQIADTVITATPITDGDQDDGLQQMPDTVVATTPKKSPGRPPSDVPARLQKIIDALVAYAADTEQDFDPLNAPGPVGGSPNDEGSLHWFCASLDRAFRQTKSTFEGHRAKVLAVAPYAQTTDFYRAALPHIAQKLGVTLPKN